MSDAILNTSIPHHEDAFTEISEIPNTKDLNSNDDNSSAFQDLQIESQKEESVSLKDKNDGASHSQDGKSLLSQEEEEEDDEKKDIIMNGPVVEGSLEDSFLQAEADVTLSSDSVESVVLESRCGDVPINDTGQCTLCCSCLSPNLDYYDSGIENSSMVNDSTVSQSKEGEFAENNSSSQVLVETDGQRCCDATDGCCETERRIGLCDEESPNHFVDRPNLNENVFVEEPRTDDISLLEQTEAGLKQVEEDSTMDCVCDCADVTTKESCNFSVTTMTPCLELSVENHLVVPVFHGESESVSEETREGSSNGSFNVQVLVEPISDVKTDESDPNPSSSESSDLKASPVAEDTIFLEEVDVDNHPTAVEPPPPPPDAAAAARETPCQSSETDGQLLAPECDHPTPCDSSNVSSNCNEVRQGLVGLSLDCDNLMCSANSADEKPRSDDAVSHFDDVIQGDSAAAKEVDEQSSLSAQEVVVVVDGGGGDVVSEHRDSLVENEQDDVIYDVPVEEEDEEKEEEEEENTPSALEMVEVLDETQALKKEGQCVNRCPSKSKNNNNNNCKEDAQCEEAENVKCGGETSTSLDHKNDMKEENYYEEIKKEHLEFQGHNCRERGVDEGQSLFKRCSLVEEVMSEVERVKQQHDQVLQELNLDIEQLIMPTTPPSVSSPNDDDDDENNSSFSLPETLPAVYPCTEVAPVTEAREHNLSTRTLPPLPIESSPEDLFSASR